MLLEITASLAYMHRMGLVHGDVKLANILLKSDPLHALGMTPKVRARQRGVPPPAFQPPRLTQPRRR